MKNTKNLWSGVLVLSMFVLAFLGAVSPASAENNGSDDVNSFLNAHTSLKADALIKLESSTGVVVGANGQVRAMGAKVTSATSSEINADAMFGNSALHFVIKVDSDTKINGKSDATVGSLKAGDKISFSGVITSSSSSSLTVDADHVVSRAFGSKIIKKTDFEGEIKAINESDNSFTLNLKGRTVKVSVSSSTAITLDGSASTLASLDEGDEVEVTGEFNSSTSVVTATKVTAESDDGDDNDDEDDDGDEDDEDDKDEKKEKQGWFKRFRNFFWR